MAVKKIAYDQEARERIRDGVRQLARAVKVTLGPRGRNVIIEKSFGSPTVTKDGVTVAKEIELEDPYENMGAQMVKEVASKTSDVAGDGTTTATVMAEAIFEEGLRSVAAGANPIAVKRGIDMMDCVLPSRSGRTGQAFTRRGVVNIKNARHADDPRPLDEDCTCPACSGYSRAYLHHVFRAGEMISGMLLTWHNLHYYQELMEGMRRSDELLAQLTGTTSVRAVARTRSARLLAPLGGESKTMRS